MVSVPRVTLRGIVPIAIAFAAVCFASYFGAWEQALQVIRSNSTQTRSSLLLLGDSLTEQGVDPDRSGWVALLQNRYQRSADVLPRGLSGYNTNAPDADLLVITPPRVDDAARLQRSKTGRLDRSNAEAGEYAKSCVATAERLGVAVLDLHALFNSMPAREQAMALEDGLHLSAWGNRLVDRLLRAKVADAFPALVSRLQVSTIPNWDRLM
ncbi:putative isoamyl acetate-hydrolyzing esterase 1 [Phytophthora cinnamomi]|uniref:putative isoamyl acetate-hydrolyzing esterase 1 n=1 Tax=Phytophthora cinnamomi TaxID=4785 RepID=UPI00355A2F29|nr:putative isoamyl acetate-hydrolyzing esterase 1 [Phytophthora cinnamomi]